MSALPERAITSLANPIVFAELYVRPFDPNWTEPLAEFAREMLAFCVVTKRGAIMLPPEYMKTTIVSQVYALWRTFRARVFGQLLRGMLMSEEEGMAAANLQVVKWHIEHNELLARDFHDAKGRPLVRPHPTVDVWREDAIIIDRDGVSRDPTWQAKGLDSKGIHGRRLDVFLGDDLITPRNATSPAMRRRALDTMDLQIETRVVASGQMLVAGNFNDDKDLLSTLSKRPRWELFKRPSMHQPGRPDVAARESELADPGKAVLAWPGNWTRERLLAEYREKPNRFRRIHLLDPRAEGGELLNVAWVRLVDPERTPLNYCRFFIGLDPAPGGAGHDLDFFNISVGALHDGVLDVIESYDVRAPIPQQAQLVGAFNDRFSRVGQGVIAIGCSRQALDAYFRGALEISRPDLKHKIVDVSTPGTKMERLEGLGPFAASGWLRFWEPVWHQLTSSYADQAQELSLAEQWRDFPFGNHDDKLDGIDLLQRTAREFEFVGDREFDLAVMET